MGGANPDRPLAEKRIVVTRPTGQVAELAVLLRERHAEPIAAPMVQVVDALDEGAALRNAMSRLSDYDWAIVTSPNGAHRFAHARKRGLGADDLRVAAIGPATAAVLTSAGIIVTLLPDRFVAEGMLEVFPDPPTSGGRVLLPRAADARATLPDGLRARGWIVDDVASYRTVPTELTDGQLAGVAGADAVTFTASSTVHHSVELVGIDSLPSTVACIGPATRATALELGLEVTVEATEHTLTGLVDALETFYADLGR